MRTAVSTSPTSVALLAIARGRGVAPAADIEVEVEVEDDALTRLAEQPQIDSRSYEVRRRRTRS